MAFPLSLPPTCSWRFVWQLTNTPRYAACPALPWQIAASEYAVPPARHQEPFRPVGASAQRFIIDWITCAAPCMRWLTGAWRALHADVGPITGTGMPRTAAIACSKTLFLLSKPVPRHWSSASVTNWLCHSLSALIIPAQCWRSAQSRILRDAYNLSGRSSSRTVYRSELCALRKPWVVVDAGLLLIWLFAYWPMTRSPSRRS